MLHEYLMHYWNHKADRLENKPSRILLNPYEDGFSSFNGAIEHDFKKKTPLEKNMMVLTEIP